jgi:hypothetical protein
MVACPIGSCEKGNIEVIRKKTGSERKQENSQEARVLETPVKSLP